MDVKNLRTLIRRLFYIPTCAGCKERLDPIVKETELNHGLPCFCDKCLPNFYRTTAQMCHTCGKVAGECSCMPLKKVFTQPTIPSLFFYHPDDKGIAARAIYTFKHKKYIDLCDFFAKELAPKITELLSTLEIEPSDCVFTYIPRTDKALKKHGFDQSELLAKTLCKHVGGNCTLSLLRRKSGKEQKKLTTKERQQNATNSIFAKDAIDKRHSAEILSGKTVILIDDIITTGASVKRGISELKRIGAKTVLVASIARCEIKKKK